MFCSIGERSGLASTFLFLCNATSRSSSLTTLLLPLYDWCEKCVCNRVPSQSEQLKRPMQASAVAVVMKRPTATVTLLPALLARELVGQIPHPCSAMSRNPRVAHATVPPSPCALRRCFVSRRPTASSPIRWKTCWGLPSGKRRRISYTPSTDATSCFFYPLPEWCAWDLPTHGCTHAFALWRHPSACCPARPVALSELWQKQALPQRHTNWYRDTGKLTSSVHHGRWPLRSNPISCLAGASSCAPDSKQSGARPSA